MSKSTSGNMPRLVFGGIALLFLALQFSVENEAVYQLSDAPPPLCWTLMREMSESESRSIVIQSSWTNDALVVRSDKKLEPDNSPFMNALEGHGKPRGAFWMEMAKAPFSITTSFGSPVGEFVVVGAGEGGAVGVGEWGGESEENEEEKFFFVLPCKIEGEGEGQGEGGVCTPILKEHVREMTDGIEKKRLDYPTALVSLYLEEARQRLRVHMEGEREESTCVPLSPSSACLAESPPASPCSLPCVRSPQRRRSSASTVASLTDFIFGGVGANVEEGESCTHEPKSVCVREEEKERDGISVMGVIRFVWGAFVAFVSSILFVSEVVRLVRQTSWGFWMEIKRVLRCVWEWGRTPISDFHLCVGGMLSGILLCTTAAVCRFFAVKSLSCLAIVYCAGKMGGFIQRCQRLLVLNVL
uniref:Uncharacterized protein n=1 Tax=Chromera velia CCMP2878 TaxID=1169474 RepID=A0A0G4HRW3_9ALVE|eukprot:Cvel_8150.t1-p1 / transcript=Cvel_8150.t1 / gene=Cvel_8150 / organism=Chromera_velia_CCMP2878 / gene_product=hypothetical protein / transcript_product=hypothetical protein / location=Cvel_scaffold443:63703-67068(-) / protein_length=413 / sequence_SO=supercontig / SO=protein_coding / is_pseudo=false